MALLGSIFDDWEGDGPRGLDLHWTAQVPPRALGHPLGVRVRVPLTLPGGGRRHRRTRPPGLEGEEEVLQLAADLPDGATLRVRFGGASLKGGQPGDLLLKIQVRDGELDDTWLGYVAPPASDEDRTLLYVAAAVGLLMLAGLIAAWLSG